MKLFSYAVVYCFLFYGRSSRQAEIRKEEAAKDSILKTLSRDEKIKILQTIKNTQLLEFSDSSLTGSWATHPKESEEYRKGKYLIPHEITQERKGNVLFCSFKKAEEGVFSKGNIEFKGDSLLLYFWIDTSKQITNIQSYAKFKFTIRDSTSNTYKIEVREISF